MPINSYGTMDNSQKQQKDFGEELIKKRRTDKTT